MSEILERESNFPENTRIRKAANDRDVEVLLASAQIGDTDKHFYLHDGNNLLHEVGSRRPRSSSRPHLHQTYRDSKVRRQLANIENS